MEEAKNKGNELILSSARGFKYQGFAPRDRHLGLIAKKIYKMFSRMMMNPRRVAMVLTSVRRIINPPTLTPLKTTYPQISQATHFLRGFQSRDLSSATQLKIQEFEVTNHICRILDEKEWCHEMEEELNGISKITKDDILLAFNTILLKNPEKALSFFTWYSRHPSYKPSSSVYNALLRAVGRKNYLEKFWQLVEEMTGHGFLMETETYNSVSTKIWRSRKGDELAKFFIWMTENGQEKPGAKKCYDVLQCMSSDPKPDMDTAQQVIEAYKKGGGKMSKIIYDGLHRCLTKAGRIDKARELMEKMVKEGFELENNTYRQLIYGLCRVNRLSDACRVFEEMQEKGCVPDSNTCATLIIGHCHAKETQKAMALSSEMAKKGFVVPAKMLGPYPWANNENKFGKAERGGDQQKSKGK